jgi:hypothetical protein
MIGWTARNWISFIMGLILLVVGGIPLLFFFNVIGFTIPLLPGYIFKVMAIVGGGILLIDATKETVHGRKVYMWLSIIFGVPILALGIVPLLNQYGVISFALPVTDLISNIITAGAGIVLFIDAWKS